MSSDKTSHAEQEKLAKLEFSYKNISCFFLNNFHLFVLETLLELTRASII